MSDFFWTSGHLGWGLFAIMVFSAVWLLFSDFVWRLRNVRIVRLALTMSASWIVGVGLIVAGLYIAGP